MNENLKMKKLILPIFALLIFFSCKNEDLNANKAAQPNPVTVTYKSEINKSAILPEALEYYSNIAEMAKWYAKHQDVVAQSRVQSESGVLDSLKNTLIDKLDKITILDSANNKISFFDLDEMRRDSFLSSFVTIEANDLSVKLKFDTSSLMISSFQENNNAVKAAFARIKSANSFTEDPYWKVRNVMMERENARSAIVAKEISRMKASKVQEGPMRVSEDYTFWSGLILNSQLSLSPIRISPIQLSAKTFVDRIRPSIQPGRLLIALPGGVDTYYPLILYLDGTGFDFGHVAVMNRYAPAPNTNNADISFTISTNSKEGMHQENLQNNWGNEHGLAYVGQVFDTQWRTYYNNWHSFGVRREARDASNTLIANELPPLLNQPYGGAVGILVGKFWAPKFLICSTTAWWCAKNGAKVDIGDWYKPSIWPAGVYTSDHVRIIDNTIN